MPSPERICSDCKVPLRPIHLLDDRGGAAPRTGFAYLLAGEPKLGFWKAEVTNRDGDVHGWLCESCQRVTLYAQPAPRP